MRLLLTYATSDDQYYGNYTRSADSQGHLNFYVDTNAPLRSSQYAVGIEGHASEEQTHGTNCFPGLGAIERITEELIEQEALSNDEENDVVPEHVTDNEVNFDAPHLNPLDISTLIPVTIQNLSAFELLKAVEPDSDVHSLLTLVPVHGLAQALLKSGLTPAKVRAQMEAWATQAAQVTEQQAPRTADPLTSGTFVCDLNGCGKTFSTKHNLIKHQKTTIAHNGPRTFICENCGQGFTRNDVLKKHGPTCSKKASTATLNQHDLISS